MARSDASIDIYIVSHTHWDREWYLSQRQFQYLLGTTFDEILDLLDDDQRFRYFVADGQTSLLEDYLEIRPGRQDQLQRLLREGRLAIGPWYTMPDLWLPSGESLIRNLLLGRTQCTHFGVKPQQAGYVPDSFGHIEQMPQLLNGFGIHNYLFSRGRAMSVPEDGPLEFAWKGPDGHSRLLALQLPHGYFNATLLPSADQTESLAARLRNTVAPYLDRSAVQPTTVLLLNGIDHIWVQRDLPAITDALQQQHPSYSFHHSTLTDYLNALEGRIAVDTLPEWQGCLRDTRLLPNHLHGTWSSRIDNKIENSRTTLLLEGLTEPLAGLAWICGHRDHREELNLAWRNVLQNHAHDSICGCSDDRVHEDVNVRFRHAQELGEMIIDNAGRFLRQAMPEDQGVSVLRVAGLAGAEQCADVLIDMSEPADHLVLVDDTGTSWPTQIVSTRRLRRKDMVLETNPEEIAAMHDEFWEHRVVALLPEASPVEVRAFQVRNTAAPTVDDPVQVGPASMSNRLLDVQADNDGTIRVLHKPSGMEYAGLLELLDEGDAGGGYSFTPVDNDTPRTSRQADAQVEIIESGPLRATLRVGYDWHLPAGLDDDLLARKQQLVCSRVEYDVSLTADSEMVSVSMRIDNQAEDHRIRLNIPLPFTTTAVDTERSFVVTREQMDTYDADPGQHTHPMRNWVDCSHDKGGVAFVGVGLHEFALEQQHGHTDLRLTLLRSVGYVRSCGGSWVTPQAQLKGNLEYTCALLFHQGHWQQGNVPRRAARWLSPSYIEASGRQAPPWDTLPHASVLLEQNVQDGEDHWRTTPSHRSAWRRLFGQRDGWRRSEKPSQNTPRLPVRITPLTVEKGNILFSTLKPAEQTGSPDLVLRLYSYSPQPQTAVLRINLPTRNVSICNLAEEPITPITPQDGKITLEMRPFQICTIRFNAATPPDGKSQ